MYSCVNKCENQTKKIARNKHVIWLICERFLREKNQKKTENALFWTEEQFGRASKKMNAKKPKKTTRNTES